MKCDQIQVNLLDYAKGRLSSTESRQIKSHLDSCIECKALLAEEIAFDMQLSTVPSEEPANDVWAMIRSRTKPRRMNVFARLSNAISTHHRRATATAVALGAIGVVVFSNLPVDERSQPASAVKPPVKSVAVVKWSDDPLGKHTDAMVGLIDKM